jgi:hypothetical protein
MRDSPFGVRAEHTCVGVSALRRLNGLGGIYRILMRAQRARGSHRIPSTGLTVAIHATTVGFPVSADFAAFIGSEPFSSGTASR